MSSTSQPSGSSAVPSQSIYPETRSPRPRVLVVDDDISLMRLVRAILRSADYEVETAANGLEALEVVANVCPDVIVLDLSMPVLDGRGFFTRLRARGDKTPVLVASSFGARSAQRELGAEGAIEKPFDPEALIGAVDDLVAAADATS